MDNILEIARGQYGTWADRPLPFKLHVIWERGVTAARTVIPEFTTAEEAVHWAQLHGNSWFNHRFPQTVAEINLPAFWEVVRKEFPAFDLIESGLSESPFSRADTVIEHLGKWYSMIFFWHLRPLLASTAYLCPNPKSVLEVGGGLGELARLFRLKHPEICYTISDLPTSLFFADVFLRLNFPNTPMVYGAEPVPEGGFRLLLPDEALHTWWPYDMAINQGSMQEMTEDAIRFWFDMLHRHTRRFYSLNYASTPLPLEGWETVRREENPESVRMTARTEWLELCLEAPR